MINDYAVMLFFTLTLASLLYYFRMQSSKRPFFRIYPVAMSLITVLGVAIILNELPSFPYIVIAASFALLLPLLPSYFMMKRGAFVATLALLILELVYTVHNSSAMLFPFIQAFAIGTIYGMPHISNALFDGNKRKENKRVEVRRDAVQIMMGVALLLLFYFLNPYTASYITVVLLLVGYISGGLLIGHRDNILYKALSTLERPDALFGSGALYLSIGTAIVVGFVYDAHFIMIGIAALFIADSLATIVGKNFDMIKLPYNRRKTLSGTLAFFFTVLVIAYPIVGYYAFAFAAGLAVLESIDLKLDDNISIAFAMVALYAIYLAIF